jgi:hypothetical protein
MAAVDAQVRGRNKIGTTSSELKGDPVSYVYDHCLLAKLLPIFLTSVDTSSIALYVIMRSYFDRD